MAAATKKRKNVRKIKHNNNNNNNKPTELEVERRSTRIKCNLFVLRYKNENEN